LDGILMRNILGLQSSYLRDSNWKIYRNGVSASRVRALLQSSYLRDSNWKRMSIRIFGGSSVATVLPA